jgi:hypothetical protein
VSLPLDRDDLSAPPDGQQTWGQLLDRRSRKSPLKKISGTSTRPDASHSEAALPRSVLSNPPADLPQQLLELEPRRNWQLATLAERSENLDRTGDLVLRAVAYEQRHTGPGGLCLQNG